MKNTIFHPQRKVDVILDTDVYNEIDDLFAICYLCGKTEEFSVKGITIAPFFNERVTSVSESIVKSREEAETLLKLMDRTEIPLYNGSEEYLPDEKTPVLSDAAQFIVDCSKNYSAENRLYVIAIGAITNVSSAILLDPTVCERIAVVWLGGNTAYWKHNDEFNLRQDIAGARVLLNAEVPFLQVPCMGVVSTFYTGKCELERFLLGKTPLCDYLVKRTVTTAETESKFPTWSRVIWDVVAVASLLGDEFVRIETQPRRLPAYQTNLYEAPLSKQMECVEEVNRDALLFDLFQTLSSL